MIKLTIPRLPKSPNSLRARHWSVKHKDKKIWDMFIAVLVPSEAKLLEGYRDRRMVQVRLFYAGRPLDPDNLHGSIKPILDALKNNWLIYDDAEEWLVYTVSQQKVATRKEERTEIAIWTLGVPFLSPEVDG